MSKVTRFEDLIVWQKARSIAVSVYSITDNGQFASDYILKNQMRRASISISSNIAEGFERNGNKEFVQFLSIAKSSAGELRSQLYLALDLQFIKEREFNALLNDVVEISKMISGLLEYLKNNELKGSKFMESETNYQVQSNSGNENQ
jgi:four helix bundle protein